MKTRVFDFPAGVVLDLAMVVPAVPPDPNIGARGYQSIFAPSSGVRKVASELGWRLPNDPPENTIEVSERLKTRLVRDFTNAQIGIQQQVSRVLNPNAGEIL